MTFGGDPNGAPLADDRPRSCPGSWFRPSPSCGSWTWTRPWIASWSWPAMASGMSCRPWKGLGRGRGKWEDAKHGEICSQFIWIYDISIYFVASWGERNEHGVFSCWHCDGLRWVAMGCDGLRWVAICSFEPLRDCYHAQWLAQCDGAPAKLKWCRGSKHRKKERKK